MALIDDFLDRAGSGAVIMASPDAIPDLMSNTKATAWGERGNWQTYRGHLVEPHDEWSWGWMVRKADGSPIERDAA